MRTGGVRWGGSGVFKGQTLTGAAARSGDADREGVEGAIANARSALDGSDVEAIKSATERLQAAAMKMGEALYKAQAEAAQPAADATAGAGGANGPGPGRKVVDAEFEDLHQPGSAGPSGGSSGPPRPV